MKTISGENSENVREEAFLVMKKGRRTTAKGYFWNNLIIIYLFKRSVPNIKRVAGNSFFICQ